MPDILDDDEMRQAIDLAKSMYTPKPDEPFTQGHLLPIKKYESGRLEFDPTAGIIGQISELGSGVKNLMTGNTPVFEINDQGETVPNQQAIGTALNVAGNIMGGGIPASALERSGGMMLGTSGTRMLPETAAVELAKRELSPVGLYSHGAEAAKSIPQAKGAAEQMVGMLRKQPGVSENELINAGILTPEGQLHPDFASRGTITREDLSSHLQSSMPQVEESILKPSSLSPEEQERLFDLEEFPINVLSENEFNEMERLREIYDGEYKTKYESYALPGGENYREVLLRMPNAGDGGATDWVPGLGRVTQPHPDARQAPAFRSPHWDEPNVLAHIRMADRTGPNGEKILHVEEVQSDWGQKGKKEGFRSSANVNQFKIKEMPGFNSEYNDFFNKWELSTDNQQLGNISKVEKNGKEKFLPNLILRQNTPHQLGEFETYEDALNAVKNLNVFGYKQTHSLNQLPIDAEKLTALYLNKDEALKEASKHGIPSAPYVTSTQGWTDLALKRILKEAAEGGYDKVVWTPGAEQAGRYDLSKQISELELVHNKNGEGKLTFVDKNLIPHQQDVKGPEHLAELVGKDLAEKLYEKSKQNNGMARLAGLDLQVGGEGMKEYYDKILPNRLQSVAKKHDKNAKVGYTDVMLPPSGKQGTNNPPIQAPGLDITPQMRESILKGQGAFQRGGRTMGNNAIGNALRLASGGDADIEMPRSLKELQDWNKTHSRKKPPNMDDYFTNKVTGVEGANPVSMPNDLNELIAYLRRQRDAGGRTGFGFGGDSDAAEGSSYSENIDRYTPEVSHADIERASMEALDRAYNAGELSRPTERDSVFTGSINRGLPEDGGPSFKVDDSMGGGRGIPEGSESLFKPDPSYTGQIGRQPQLGGVNIGKSLYDQARDASNSYGMAYARLVGKKYTDAGVAGLLGNAMYESAGLNPAAINKASGATGLFQHLGDRKTNLLDAVNASGLTGDELKDALQGTQSAQLAFALNEAATNPAYKLTQQALETATDPYKASDVVMKNFERPGAIDEALSGGLRAAYANQIYQGVPSAATMTPEELQASAPGFKATNASASGTGLERFFGTNDDRISELERLGNRYVGGDRNAVASALGVDPSQLKARIVDVNGQQKVDYYTKDLSDMFKTGASNLFGSGTSSYSGPKGPNMDVVNADIANRAAQERSSYGPYGDMTREEYRALYGGKDTSNIINAAVAAAQPTAAAAPYTTELGKLSLQLPSTTGQTAQQWADANTGGDMSKVHARIKYVGGAPRLEYYTV